MSAYDWPQPAGARRPDDRRGRARWNASRGLFGGGEVGSRAVSRAAPSAGADLWQPIGPLAVLGGQSAGGPRVTGRIRDVWVEPTKGLRAYAAAATGGVWYTDDGATSWRAIGGWRPADPTATNVAANPLATGCLWVTFGKTGTADDPTKDDVWVGTGERSMPADGMPGDQLPGVGILRAKDPSSKPETDPVFVAEASNLIGASVFRLARQPAGGAMAAATSKGIVERPGGDAPQALWTSPAGMPTAAGNKPLLCADVVWTPAVGGQPARLWAAVRQPGSHTTELHWRADGGNTFTRVTLPPGPTGTPPDTRFILAASPTGDTVWVLGSGPRVWRIDATVATPAGVLLANPPNLYQGKPTGEPKGAIAVDPSNPARVALGGTAFGGGAALYLGAVTSPAAGQFRYPGGADIGDDVHADVLAIRFTDDGKQVWVACDGGVFVSTQSGAKRTFVARNGGLAVIEAGFVANHPTNDAAVLLGAQDNATQRRVGESLWKWEQGGDGGGLAFDQVATQQYVAQYINSDWSNGTTAPKPPVQRGANPASEQAEDTAAGFYSTPATIANGAKNQLAVGTNRVWYTENWGTKWVTLPTNDDPRKAAPNDAMDALPADEGAIRVLRWATVDRLWVMLRRSLYQLRRTAGTWDKPIKKIDLTDVFHPAKSTDVAASDTCNDIAVHDPARGTTGSLYLALNGDLSADGSDQLWWYDGTSKWFKTGLRTKTTASALAVVVEPGHLDTIYVGTAIGVYRTTISFNGNDPVFQPWTRLDNGLPDVAVQDLAVFSVGPIRLLRAATQARGIWELDLTGPVGSSTYVRVHEYDSRRTSPTDLTAPFVAKVPDPANPPALKGVDYSWHASPDLRVHPKLGTMAAPASLPWNLAKHPVASGAKADPLGVWQLWRFQTALRKVDRRSEPTGTWDSEFDAVLLGNGAPTPAGKATIDKPFWQSIVKAPNLTQLPWDTATPTEADLVEYLPTETTSLAVDSPSVTLPRAVLTAQVVVHHRGFIAAAATDVQVTLLYRLIPKWQTKKSINWLPDPVGWTAAITALLTNGSAPSLPADWHLADTGAPRRQPGRDVAAGTPQVASFDVDFTTGVKAGTLALLVAVVHDPGDAVTLAESPLRQLTLDRRYVAVRSVLLR